MKSPINKKRAQRKFYRGEFDSLKEHENIIDVTYNINGIGQCGLICRWHVNKNNEIDITPIGIVIDDSGFKGEVRLSEVEVNGAKCLSINDYYEETVKTKGLQMSNALLEEKVIETEEIYKLVCDKLGFRIE